MGGYLLLLAALAAPAAEQQKSAAPTPAPVPAEVPGQSGTVPPAPTAEGGDIVVTAQKRSERLRDVPASIAVLPGRNLEQQGATSLTQYASYVPSLNVDTLGSPGQTRLTLRGIAPIGSGAVVGSYLDDIPIGSSTGRSGARELGLDVLPYDVDRLEILRGPQGTLYGASTMGGLIKYVTAQPSLTTFEGRVGGELSTTRGAGDLGWSLRGMVNAPIVRDTLALRVTGYEQHSPGYIDNPVLGRRDYNDVIQRGGRASLRWAATDNLDLRLSALYQEVRSDNPAAVWRGADQSKQYGDLVARYSRAQPFRQQLEVYSATGVWDLGGVSLTSATSYQHARNRIVSDQTFSWAAYFPFIDPAVTAGTSALDLRINLHKYTQELRLASRSGGTFEWLVGGFWTGERSRISQQADARAPSGTIIPSLAPFFDDRQRDAYNEIAGFANATLRLGDRIEINGGGRLARNVQRFSETIDGVFGYLILPPPGPPSTTSGRSSESVFTYTVGPKFKLSEDAMIYGRIARGYRPGRPNIAVRGVPGQVDSDTLTNYEAGLKADLFDHRGSINLAVYTIDWNGIQVTTLDPATNISFAINAGEARSRGVEIESSFTPVRGLRLGLNGAFNDAKLAGDLPPRAAALGWRKGDRLPYSARWNVSTTLDYTTSVGRGWNAQAGGGYRYVSSRYSAVESSPLALRLGDYHVVDLNAGLSNARYSIRAYVRNLFDSRPFLGASLQLDPLTGDPDHVETTILQPRTIGLSFDVKF